MVHQIDIQSLIDIGFVLLVTAACFQSLFKGSRESETHKKRWQTELRALEQVLRGLIEEAGAASQNLDRNLLKRKVELENLLRRLEQTEEGAITGDGNSQYRSHTGQPIPRDPSIPPDALPNETWETAPKYDRISAAAQAARRAYNAPKAMSPAPGTVNGRQELAAAWMPEPNRETNAAFRRGLNGTNGTHKTPAFASAESEQELVTDDGIFEQLNIVDPITYKIAKRLLSRNKEIHVVARKLELPVSEVRKLDKLMREEIRNRQKEEPSLEGQIEAQHTMNLEQKKGSLQPVASRDAADFQVMAPKRVSREAATQASLAGEIEIEDINKANSTAGRLAGVGEISNY